MKARQKWDLLVLNSKSLVSFYVNFEKFYTSDVFYVFALSMYVIFEELLFTEKDDSELCFAI